MKRKLTIWLLTVALVLCCSGCTNGKSNSGKLYIPMIARGFQHQFWQTVKSGAEQAAKDFDVEVYFDGPGSETDIATQVDMIKKELAKNPKVMVMAPVSAEAVQEIFDDCAYKKLPIICFDEYMTDNASGAVKATASTDNYAAAKIVAEKMMENEGFVSKLKSATPSKPAVIGVLSQDATSPSIIDRTSGFVDQMVKVASKYGKVSIEGHTKWAKPVDGASIILRVEVSATTEAISVQSSANALLANKRLVALFCTNEGAVTGLLASVSDGADLASGGKYGKLLVTGFDAGAAQKNAVRKGWFYGSVTQDPYTIGYKAVEMAYRAANGEKVSDFDTGAKWYDSSNIDQKEIARLLYD